MGDFAPMGVIFGLDIDNELALQKEAEVMRGLDQGLPEAARRGAAPTSDALRPMDGALLTSRESARLLSEEFGLHLPRAVTSAIGKMMPEIAGLGTAFIAAFAIKEIPAFLEKIREETDEIAGFTKEVKAFYADTLAEQHKLLTQFASAQEGITLVQQTRQHIEQLRQEKQALDGVSEAYTSTLPGAVLYYVGVYRKKQDLDKEDAELGKLLIEQLHALSKVQDKELGPAIEGATKALHGHTAALAVHIPKLPPLTLSVEQLALAWRHDEQEENRALSATLRLIQGHTGLQSSLQANVGMQMLFAHSLDNIPKMEAEAATQATLWARAIALTKNATNDALLAEGGRLTATLGFRRVAAGIEAGWETAKGIQSLAEWDFRGAALHFMSAAEFGIIAGTGGHGAGGAGGGYGYGGREPRFLNARGSEPGNRESGMSRGSGGGTTVILNVQGHLMTTHESIDYLTAALTDAVVNRDAHLVSSHTKDSTLMRDTYNG